jgi:haloalkane dehalogenase
VQEDAPLQVHPVNETSTGFGEEQACNQDDGRCDRQNEMWWDRVGDQVKATECDSRLQHHPNRRKHDRRPGATDVDFLKLNSIVPVAHDAGGVAAINFTLAKPKAIGGLVLLNTFYADAPTLRIPELIELFSLPQTRAFGLAMASDPKQLAFLLRFQQLQFEIGVSQAQIDVIDKLVQPLIFNNFAQQPSAGPAFAALAADLRPQMAVNNLQVSKLAELGIPTTIVWGKSDAYLNVGVAQDLAGHFKGATVHLLDAGHWPQLDLPEDVGRYLLAER